MVRPSNFLTSIRAIHASQTPVIEMVPIKSVSHLYKGMMRRHQKLYGNDSIAPSQARPFTKAIIMQLLDVPEDFRISGTFRVSDDSLLWHSWRVYVALAAQSGFRKSELAVCANDTWDPSHISEASVSWVIQGDHIAWANASQLRSLSEGDYLMVRPPPSKADLSRWFGGIARFSSPLEHMNRSTQHAWCGTGSYDFRFPQLPLLKRRFS